MKKLIIVLALILIAAFVVYKYVFKENESVMNKEPFETVNQTSFLHTITANDSTVNKKYYNKVIQVTGTIKNIQTTNENTTIEMADTTDMSSIICDMDVRYLPEPTTLPKAGATVTIKGIFTGYSSELLGTTVNLNFCILK